MIENRPREPNNAIFISPSQAVIGKRSAKSVESGDVVRAESIQSDRDFDYRGDNSQRYDPKSRANFSSLNNSCSYLRH